MIAAMCMLIPPLLVVFLREKWFHAHRSNYERLLSYAFSYLFVNGTMLLLLCFVMKNDGNLFYNLNTYSIFACKYMLCAVALAVVAPVAEYFCRQTYQEIKNQGDNVAAESKASGGSDRQSAIELLKVIAIFLVVISHVTQTLGSGSSYVSYSDYVLNLSAATTDFQTLVLSVMQSFGTLGNAIFFVCSAWFLVDGKKANYKKILYMLVDVWAVSVIILILFCVFQEEAVNPRLIRNSLFPTTFSNNWYLTYYMIFYAIHPVLNKIIGG